MNNDLISRYALLRVLGGFLAEAYKTDNQQQAGVFRLAVRQVENAPAVDAEPVRHGRWGEYETHYGFPSLDGFPCSICGMHQTDIRGLYYCPNCGAKMDKEEEHER